MTNVDELETLREPPFTEAVVKFSDLLLQSRRAFLLGAGCSKCAGLPLTAELTCKVLQSTSLSAASRHLLSEISQDFKGSQASNIEDYLSELIDLLAIAQRRADRGATNNAITIHSNSYTKDELVSAADEIKSTIAKIIDGNISLDTHRKFVSSIHRPIRVGKPSPGQLVDYLVLNYDTAIEDSLALERVPYADGIDGGRTGWWNPACFERDGLAARVLKLHGSIDWYEFSNDPLPRRIAPGVELDDSSVRHVLIWPATTKYREAQLDPYAQIADRARIAVRPTRGEQRVLIICGFSFGDSHINTELDRALRNADGDLTIVAFTSEDEPHGILQQWNADPFVREQVLIYANRGFYHGDTACSAESDIPWWKFENITRMISGDL